MYYYSIPFKHLPDTQIHRLNNVVWTWSKTLHLCVVFHLYRSKVALLYRITIVQQLNHFVISSKLNIYEHIACLILIKSQFCQILTNHLKHLIIIFKNTPFVMTLENCWTWKYPDPPFLGLRMDRLLPL